MTLKKLRIFKMLIPYRSVWKHRKIVVILFVMICLTAVLANFLSLYELRRFQKLRQEMERTLRSGTLGSWWEKGLDQGISSKSSMKVQTQVHSVIQGLTNHHNEKPEINIMSGGTGNFSWKTLGANLSLFSAYYDDRQSSTGGLVILGYEKMPKEPQNLSCLVIMIGDKAPSVQGPVERVMIAEKWRERTERYRGILYKCNLTKPGKPKYVTLIHRTDVINNLSSTSYVPVADARFPEKVHKFGVCYETPLYRYKYDQEIMHSIEMNTELGATWFTIYVYEAHAKALEILKYYSHKQKILDAVYNWGENMPDPVYNHGLTVGIHDCVYRNMYKVRYLVLYDIDEYITPVQGFNWNDLLPKIDGTRRAHFVFPHLSFHKNKSKTELRCHEKSNITYKMPRFFSYHRRSGNVTVRYQQSKSIIKPKYSISVEVHHQRFMLPGYEAYFVTPDIGVMKHFRESYHPKYRGGNFTLDYDMDYYKPAVLGSLKRYYCGRDVTTAQEEYIHF